MSETHTLLQSPVNTFSGLRASRVSRKGVPHKWYEVLAMHLAGRRPAEIQALTGYSSAAYYRILASPDVIALRQQMLEDVSKDFEALWPKVINNIREQLDSIDEKTQLAAQQQFFKATGRFAPVTTENGDKASASDIVKQLLAQQVNVTVNIGGGTNGVCEVEDFEDV